MNKNQEVTNKLKPCKGGVKMQEFIIEDKVKFLVEVIDGGKYRVHPYLSTPSGRWLEQPVQVFNSQTEWMAYFKETYDAYTPKKQQ